MSQSIPRKPVASETEAMQVPARISSKKARTQVIPDHPAQSNDAELDGSVQDVQYLAPLVSRLDIGGSQDSEVLEAGVSGTNQPTTLSLRSAETVSETYSPSKVKKTSLDKPLPKLPAVENDSNDELEQLEGLQPHPGVRPSVKTRARSERTLQRNKVTANDLDLSNTKDTLVRTKWAPAVTHETIKQDVHQVEEKTITRELHQHHVYHRILPIHDVEVLPAKHYVETKAGLQEISEDQLPNRASKNTQRLVAENFNNTLPEDSSTAGRRQFTARHFPNTEGDYKEYASPTGSARTERCWVHPPTLEKGGKESGQTRPFHLGSSDSADDGFRDET